MDARAYLLERRPMIDAALEAALPAADEPPQGLHGAMRHLLFPGGKRLRPTLALAAAEAVGASPGAALPAAVAVELIHTYSLVHDDLPCMDDDTERRGRPTVHVAFDEATAVLAGDALQARAFGVLCETTSGVDPAVQLAAAVDLAEACGSRALAGGQADDLAAGPDLDADRILSIHERKSAALLACAIVCGARLGGASLGGAPDALLGRLRRFGVESGVAFQIADDLLDADEDAGPSLVRALGAEAARARAEALLAGALNEIEDLGERAEPLRELARYAVRRSE